MDDNNSHKTNEMTRRGSCHCGSVKFEVVLSDGFNTIRRCNCSLCSMRGAVAASAKLSDLKIVSGEENLTIYQFNTKVAEHYFCKKCGIYTHHKRRSNPDEFGINIACLEGVSPFDFTTVAVCEGRIHPKDLEGRDPDYIAGVLHYEESKN